MTSEDTGTIQAMLERLTHQRIPRALEIKSRVDAGEPLLDLDVQFLEQVFEDANVARPLISHHPELEPLVSKLVSLYSDITAKALENEKNRGA